MKPTPNKTTILAGVVMTFLGCGSAAFAAEKTDSRIHVEIDPRIELFSIVFRLAGNPEYNVAADLKYAGEVDKYFAKHKDHPAIKTAKKLASDHDVAFETVLSLAVHLNDAYKLAERVPLNSRTKSLDSRWPTKLIPQFLEQLRDFVEVSKFKAFVAQHQKFYAESAKRLNKAVEKSKYATWFNGYFAPRSKTVYDASVGLLLGPYTYAVGVDLPGGREEVHLIAGVLFSDTKDLPVFDSDLEGGIVDALCTYSVVPLLNANVSKIKGPTSKIFDQIRDKMTSHGFPDWWSLARESCVRACRVRYVANTYGNRRARTELYRHQGLGFLWMPDLVDLLADYEANRKRYPTLDSFFPKIVSLFEDYAKRGIVNPDLIASGPIARVISRQAREDDVIIVAPDTVADKEVATVVSQYVQHIWNSLYRNAKVDEPIPAGQVTDVMKKTKAMVLYGSPASNAVLKDILKKCKFVVEKDRIVAGGKVFKGEDLILMTCFPNPYNRQKPLLIFASANAKNIINANAFVLGPTDYVIAKWGSDNEPIVISEDDYTKRPDGTWVIEK
jgi:Domain of unknown function (DUF4932)